MNALKSQIVEKFQIESGSTKVVVEKVEGILGAIMSNTTGWQKVVTASILAVVVAGGYCHKNWVEYQNSTLNKIPDESTKRAAIELSSKRGLAGADTPVAPSHHASPNFKFTSWHYGRICIMEIIVEIKKRPGSNGLCELLSVALTEDDLFEAAERKAASMGVGRADIFDHEILHIKP